MENKKKNTFKTVVKWYFTKMRIWWKTSLIILSLLALLMFLLINSLYKENIATKACENIYTTKVEKFSDQTGITMDNIFFRPPTITKSKNMYTVVWDKSIIVAGDEDSFKCQYNFSTNKGYDRTE